MTWLTRLAVVSFLSALIVCLAGDLGMTHPAATVYLGFDRNEYPGDAALPVLRKSFSFSGYWLTPPPNTSRNTWVGKRRLLTAEGFGFLLLARSRSASVSQPGSTDNGGSDAREAARNAKQEGFATGSVIFLDV